MTRLLWGAVLIASAGCVTTDITWGEKSRVQEPVAVKSRVPTVQPDQVTEVNARQAADALRLELDTEVEMGLAPKK